MCVVFRFKHYSCTLTLIIHTRKHTHTHTIYKKIPAVNSANLIQYKQWTFSQYSSHSREEKKVYNAQSHPTLLPHPHHVYPFQGSIKFSQKQHVHKIYCISSTLIRDCTSNCFSFFQLRTLFIYFLNIFYFIKHKTLQYSQLKIFWITDRICECIIYSHGPNKTSEVNFCVCVRVWGGGGGGRGGEEI